MKEKNLTQIITFYKKKWRVFAGAGIIYLIIDVVAAIFILWRGLS